MKLKKQNLKSQVVESLRGSRTLMKIFYFSEDQHFFDNSRGENSSYDRGRKVFHLLTKEACFWTGETTSANLWTEKATRTYLTEELRQSVFFRTSTSVSSIYFCLCKIFKAQNLFFFGSKLFANVALLLFPVISCSFLLFSCK